MQAQKTHQLIRLTAQLWAIVWGLYFVWEGLTYRGLFGRLAEFQIAKFGTYAPLITFLFLFVLVVLPVWIIARLLMRRSEDDMDLTALFDLRITQARRLKRYLMAFCSIAFAVAGGFAVYAGLLLPGHNGKLQTIAASEVGTVAISEGPARLVGGEMGEIIFFGQDWFIGDDRMAFSPYRPTGTSDGLARLFIQIEATKKEQLQSIVQRPAWSGIIVEGGLPGTVRVLFNSLGIKISDPYFTLYQNEASLKIRYWLQAIQWVILGLFFGLLVTLHGRTIRALKQQKSEQLL